MVLRITMLSDESIQKFKEIFKKEYGKEYTDAEAREAAENLVGFFDLLIKVDQRNKQKDIEIKALDDKIKIEKVVR